MHDKRTGFPQSENSRRLTAYTKNVIPSLFNSRRSLIIRLFSTYATNERGFAMLPLFVRKKAKQLSENRGFLLLFGCVYGLGTVFGLFFRKADEFNPLCAPVCEYYFGLFSRDKNLLGETVRYLFFHALLCGVFFGLGFTLYTAPVEGLILLYRGMILGNALPVLFVRFGFPAVPITVFLTVPYQVLSSAGIAAICVWNLSYLRSLHYCKRLHWKKIAENALCGFLICSAACVYQFIVLALIVRPITAFL